MALITVPPDLVAGEIEDIGDIDARLKAIRDMLNGLIDGANVADGTVTNADIAAAAAIDHGQLANQQKARVNRTTSQSVANVTNTAISWESAEANIGPVWAAGNPTRLTLPTAGVWLIGMYFTTFWTAGLIRECSVRVNGTTTVARSRGVRQESGLSLEHQLVAAANDYVECMVLHAFGANISYTGIAYAVFLTRT